MGSDHNHLVRREEAPETGSILEGKLADAVILSDNPVTIDPKRINKIILFETPKGGRTIFKRRTLPSTCAA